VASTGSVHALKIIFAPRRQERKVVGQGLSS